MKRLSVLVGIAAIAWAQSPDLKRGLYAVFDTSEGIITALERLFNEGQIPRGSRCVTILADRGERYLDTVYSDKMFGNESNNVFTYTGGLDTVDGAGGGDTLDYSSFGAAV